MAGEYAVTLQWQAPAITGGISVYYVAEAAGGTQTVAGNAANGDTFALTLTGLVNGLPITASVYAVNSVGAGPVAVAFATPNVLARPPPGFVAATLAANGDISP